jgi:hypothetical protein
MGSGGPGNPILQVLLLCVLASVALAAVGFFLRSRGMLRAKGPALGWAILTILPLFGAGFAMMTSHAVADATGETRAGQNAPDVRSAP